MSGNRKKMKRHTMIYKTFDIVVVPFPFTDVAMTKNRPAIVLSHENNFNKLSGQCILAMITSALHHEWPGDIHITNLRSCGLSKASLIRFKLFTLDNRLIKSRIGILTESDQKNLKDKFTKVFHNINLV